MTHREKIIIAFIPIYTVLIIYFLPKIFDSNPRMEDIKKQYVLDQMPYLHTLERLVHVAEKQTQLKGTFKIPVDKFFSTDENYNPNDSLTLTYLVPIPAIVDDSLHRNEFFRLVNKVQNGRDTISPKVYYWFENLIDYLDKYPLPSFYLGDNRSIWLNEENIRKKWYQLTRNISTSIDSVNTFK